MTVSGARPNAGDGVSGCAYPSNGSVGNRHGGPHIALERRWSWRTQNTTPFSTAIIAADNQKPKL